MAAIRINNLYKSFDKGKDVIRDFDLDVHDGEFLVLVGPSGCGKSTLLRIMAGLEVQTAGDVRIGDTLMNDVPAKNRNIAMVFQNYALYPHMNVYQNLAFGLKLKRLPKSTIDTLVKDAAEILEITDLLDRKPKQLSGGQRQRVALGRAIVRNPDVFLFDEPLSNLDAKLRIQMRAEIKKLHQRLGTTMVYVTHDQVEAMTMGDRIVVMNEGISQQIGSPEEVFNDPANRFVGSFIGSPPMNFIEGTIQGNILDNGSYQFTLGTKPIPELNGRRCIAGIRPSDIQIGEGTANLPLLVAEPLGDEFIVHLDAGQETLIVKVSADRYVQSDGKVPVHFNLEKIHFFAPESGRRLEFDS